MQISVSESVFWETQPPTVGSGGGPGKQSLKWDLGVESPLAGFPEDPAAGGQVAF